MSARDALDRLANKFTMSDGCWEWTAAKDRAGYGMVLHAGSMRGAHRVVYEVMVGPIPDGLSLDHLCRNPACVRPAHLEPVTQGENVRRGIGPETTANRWADYREAADACVNGHPYDEENTYVSPRGRRKCRTCNRAAVERKRGRASLASRGEP